MLSETLTEGLEAYEIGPTICALRSEKNMGLEQLGRHTGLSAGMLSKIERDQVFPTLATLLRIAMVFDVGLDHFFASQRDKPAVAVVRRGDRLRLPNRTDGEPAFHFESLDFPVPDRRFNAYLAEFALDAWSDPHTHAGAEIIYVISGAVCVKTGGDLHELKTGDSMYFDSIVEHSYSGASDEPSTAIFVVCPEVPRIAART